VILKKDMKAKEVCFVMSGIILNVQTDRIFSEGAMFGETDIIFKRVRTLIYFEYTGFIINN
jgi:hypothetical protein